MGTVDWARINKEAKRLIASLGLTHLPAFVHLRQDTVAETPASRFFTPGNARTASSS